MPDNITKDWIRTKADEIAVREYGCYFDVAAAEHVCQFMRTFLRHVKGPLAGQPYEPLHWHKEQIIYPIFGWKMPNGYRRHNQFDCFVPKKNAKSTIAAGIKLYMLTADGEPGAEVYSAAGDKKQASIVYNVAYQMVKANPELEEVIRLRKSQKKMYFDATASYYEVLTAEGSRNEGYDIHCLGIDELHTQKDRKLWGALRYGGASRKQPLVFTISTAGELDEESLWWERFGIAKAAQRGETNNIHYRGIVYAIEDNEDWKDPEIWKKCNPGWGETINETLFIKDFEDAQVSGANEAEFLRYHLNRATKHETSWLRRQYWINCFDTWEPDPEWQIDDEIKQPTSIIAADIADSVDLNAVVEICNLQHPEKGEVVKVIPHFWAPEDAGKNTNKANRDRYEKWWSEGYLHKMPGPIVQHPLLVDEIVKIILNSPYKVVEFGCDRYQGVQFCSRLQEALATCKNHDARKMPIRMVSYNCAQMNEPTRYLEDLITSGRLIIDNHPVMNWMFQNVKTISDSSGNRKLDKTQGSSAAGKIDGFSALTMALYISIHRQMEALKKRRSRYNDSNETLATFTLWGGYKSEAESKLVSA